MTVDSTHVLIERRRLEALREALRRWHETEPGTIDVDASADALAAAAVDLIDAAAGAAGPDEGDPQ